MAKLFYALEYRARLLTFAIRHSRNLQHVRSQSLHRPILSRIWPHSNRTYTTSRYASQSWPVALSFSLRRGHGAYFTRSVSTTTKAWLKREGKVTLKTVLLGNIAIGLLAWTAYGATMIYFEWKYPTPDEYPYRVRAFLRSAHMNEDWSDNAMWAVTYLQAALALLDQEVEQGSTETGTSPDELRQRKSDEWRRSYTEILTHGARLWHDVGDDLTSRDWFQRVLQTPFALPVQHYTAAMQLAEFSVDDNKKEELYTMAFNLCSSSLTEATPGIIPEDIGVTTEVVASSTALAIHYARTNQLSLALPVFLSVLRARQVAMASKLDPPGSGKLGDICEQGAVMVYISEVLWGLGIMKDALAWLQQASTVAFQGAQHYDGSRQDHYSEVSRARLARCRKCSEDAGRKEIIMSDKMGGEKAAQAAILRLQNSLKIRDASRLVQTRANR